MKAHYDEILNQYIHEVADREIAGSGDDQMHVQRVERYFGDNRAIWLEATERFVKLGEQKPRMCTGELTAVRLIFERFDKYAVIKDDQWYKDLKAEVLRGR